jgi:hypothetical protein
MRLVPYFLVAPYLLYFFCFIREDKSVAVYLTQPINQHVYYPNND